MGGFTWRDDDWEVTRLASLQPIRAEQIGLFCCCPLRNHTVARYEIVLRPIVTRDVSHPS